MLAQVRRAGNSLSTSAAAPIDETHPPAPLALLPILYRRRWTLIGVVCLCLVAAVLYLIKVTPIWTSNSRIYVEQHGQQIMADTNGGYAPQSDAFLYTQAEILKSAPLLQKAATAVNWHAMRTFGASYGNVKTDSPVPWLQTGNAFSVDVGKKDNIITVSLKSPYPEEATVFVDAVVAAYIDECSDRMKSTAAQMLRVLQAEKKDRDQELDQRLQALTKYKQDNGALSFSSNDKGNIILERLATLSAALTQAQLDAVDSQTKRDQIKAVLADPRLIPAYVQIVQSEAKNNGDLEYQGLMDLYHKVRLNMVTDAGQVGIENKRAVAASAALDDLQHQIDAKERSMAEASLTSAESQLVAVNERVEQLQSSFDAQQKEALALNAKAAEYARLEADVERTQKQCDLLDARIKEINVNSADAGVLNVQTLETANAGEKPTSPKKALTLALALVIGGMLGAGVAFVQDTVDQRLRSAEDVSASLNVPILGVIPHIEGREPIEVRGQYVQAFSSSNVSEAFRTVRTALYFGAKDAKTLLVTSPSPGDGKSTTASNLAIAMAQAGHRTLLIDCDLRKPSQQKIHGIEGVHGLTEVIEGKAKLKNAVARSTTVPHLFLLPCGRIPANPSEILTSARFTQVLHAASTAFDRIVIDSPPVGVVSDAQVLTSLADATVLVVRVEKSTRRASLFALDALASTGGHIAGAVVNDAKRGGAGYGYYYPGYYGVAGRDRQRLSVVSLNGAAESEGSIAGLEAIGSGNGKHPAGNATPSSVEGPDASGKVSH